jgi:hypothetical protein
MTGQRPKKTNKVVTITPEMIEAGARALVITDTSSDEDVVWKVLLAVFGRGGYSLVDFA